jgi:lysine 2,3-aminomutase
MAIMPEIFDVTPRLLGRRERRPVRNIIDPRGLPWVGGDLASMEKVTERFAFRTNDYYAGLIDWSDPADPIRRLIVPDAGELIDFGSEDASNEAANTKMLGLQHKYADTALLLVTDQCAGFCRYCFRKRLFLPGSRETNREVAAGLDYIRNHPGITDVLLTGGDPLTLPTSRLNTIVTAVRDIDHVHTIRIGSKVPAFNPYRILDDPDLQAMFAEQTDRPGRIYIVTHFDHPRELTAPAREAIALLRSIGVMCINQTPLTAGINDDADVLAELFQACTDTGCPQYYVFQCRPAFGNASFEVPLTRAFALVSQARSRVSGLSRRARYCISHASGKIETVGMDDAHIFLRYHRAKDPADDGRMLVMKRDDAAYWFDQLEPADC